MILLINDCGLLALNAHFGERGEPFSSLSEGIIKEIYKALRDSVLVGCKFRGNREVMAL